MRLAPALVGPPDPDLDVPERPPDLAPGRRRDGVRRVRLGRARARRPTCSTRGSRRRSGRSRRSAGPRQTPELDRYYPGDVNVTAREIIRLWENRMIFSGLFLLGDIPFTDVIINSTVLAVDGRRMSKSLGTGIDPLEAVEQARRRRDPLRPAEDLLDAGRPLQLGRDRGGRQAREQALERRAADPPAAPRASTPALAARGARGDVDRSRRIDETRAEIEELLLALRLRARRRRALPPHLRRLLRLVRRGDQAAALRGRPRGDRRPRSPRSSGCSRCCTRCCRT